MRPDATGRRAIWQILLLAAGLVVLTVISAGSVYLVNKAREDARWVLHTVEVENQLALTQLQLRRAESAQRGYLSTLLPAFQNDFEDAASHLTPALTQLGQLISDNPVQKRLLDEMFPLAKQRIEEFRNTIDLARTERVNDATRIVREGIGRNAMNRIDALARQMRAEEDRLFVLRTTNADRSQTLAASLTGIGSGLVVVLAGDFDLSGAALGARPRRRRNRSCATTISIWRPPSTNAPPIFAKPTTRSSASPISSATICARRWSTSWGSPASWRNCAATSSSGSRRWPAPSPAAPPAPENATDTAEPALEGADKQLSQDFCGGARSSSNRRSPRWIA